MRLRQRGKLTVKLRVAGIPMNLTGIAPLYDEPDVHSRPVGRMGPITNTVGDAMSILNNMDPSDNIEIQSVTITWNK